MKRYLPFFLIWFSCASRLGAAPGDLKWAFPTGGPVRSSPALATNGYIVFGSHDFNVYAVNAVGELKWKAATRGKVVSSPAIGGDSVYIGVTEGLIALDLNTGLQRWQFTTNAVIASPAIAPSGLVCLQDRSGHLYGLDAISGLKKWQTNILRFIANPVCYSSPVADNKGRLFVGAAAFALDAGQPPNGFMVAVDATSGKILWNLDGTNAFQSTAAFGSDGTLYVGGFDKSLHAIDPSNGVEKWSLLTGDSISASAAIGPDRTLYVGAHDGFLYAIDSQSGSRKWKFLTRDSIHSSVAIAADGTIYFGSYDKSFYALDGATGQKKWSFTTGGFVLSSPVIGPDGTVYVGSHDGNLYAFEGSAPPADSPWPMFKGNSQRTGSRE